MLLPLHASAQEAPRAGRVLFGLTENPAVFVGPDRAWILGSESDALPTALCGPVLCRPVVRAEACVAPRCPGMGRLVYASERVHDVRDFPTDRDLMNCVLELLKAGQENLDVICWAHHYHIPSDSVLGILEALDINARRPTHQHVAFIRRATLENLILLR